MLAGGEEPVSWKLAAAWMIFLAPFFFAVYGACNWITAQRAHVDSFSWGWEHQIWFVPALIVPYMSLDLFYAGSTFLCGTRADLHALARRLIFAILAAAICFVLFPLKLVFVRPATTGFYGWMFGFLALDQPYNLAPSLHIALRSIVWVPYGRVVTGVPKTLLKVWFLLIGVSTLLTYQHQVVDVICGEILTIVTFYLIPAKGPAPFRVRSKPLNVRLATIYAASAILLTLAAILLRPWGVILAWPALSLALISFAYAGAGPAIFQKRDGVISWPARALLAPYLIVKWLSCAAYHLLDPGCAEVAPGVVMGSWLGRDLKCAAVLDLTAEFSGRRRLRASAYKNIAVVDLTLPTLDQVREAVAFIAHHAPAGGVYVHCALGYSRSAGIAAAYLLASGQAASAAEAARKIRDVRPQIVLSPEWMNLLREFAPQT